MRIKEMALIAALLLCAAPLACAQNKRPLTGKKAEQAKAELSLRLGEARELKDKATEITKTIGELVSSGKLPQDAQGVQTLQQLVDQLKQINERMTAIEKQVQDVQSFIDGERKSMPSMEQVAAAQKTKFSGSIQTQYRDSDLPGQLDGFRMRETRLGVTHQIDKKTSFKLQVELAGSDFGSTINEPTESTVQMRDAFLTYKFDPDRPANSATAIMGRQPVPLGYDIERSSTEREFPERALYNTTFFPGERSTGIQIRQGLGKNAIVYLGGMNALTFNDPEQRTVQGPPGNRLAALGGIRYTNGGFNGGISGFFGKRASQYGTGFANPTNDRRFVYLDGAYTVNPKVTVRAEAMMGHDRIPTGAATAGNNARDVSGGQFQVGYSFDAQNQLHFRYETFDPNADKSNDQYSGLNLAFLHYLNPNARITLAHEMIRDEARTTKEKYGITTLRVQFKF